MYLETDEKKLKQMKFIELWKLKTSVIAWSKFYYDNGNNLEYKKMENKLMIITKYLPDKVRKYENN